MTNKNQKIIIAYDPLKAIKSERGEAIKPPQVFKKKKGKGSYSRNTKHKKDFNTHTNWC